MKFKIALSTATALGLMMGGAMADGNQAYIDQNNDNNSALITQGGSDNWAGYSDYKTYGSDPVRQDGNYNSLTINQVGDANEAGVSTYGSGYSGTGIDQIGDRNILDIQQISSGGRVHQVEQKALQSATPTNSLTITQSGEGVTSNRSNRVNSVRQWHNGGAQNSVNISQHRTGGTEGHKIGDGSSVSSSVGYGVVQSGSGNQLTATQDSLGGVNGPNRILYMSQTGQDNAISASQNAHRNLIGIMSSPSAGVEGTGIIQVGDGNTATAIQDGKDNQIETIRQFGSLNFAFVEQVGNSNIADSLEFGDDNSTKVNQSGTANEAYAEVFGDDNYLNFRQSGTSNVAAVFIDGSGNNAVGLSKPFSGDALTVRNVVRNSPLGESAFRRGDLFQEGSNNTLRGTTLDSPFEVKGNNNTFATFQKGDNNTISGFIDGNTNQAVVAQIGNSNTAAFTQTGGGNNLGISQ